MVRKKKKCSECDIAVALGTSIRVCKSLGNKKKCRELYKKVTKGDIEPDVVFKEVRKMAKGHKDETKLMNMVDRFLKEAGYGKSKGKKS